MLRKKLQCNGNVRFKNGTKDLFLGSINTINTCNSFLEIKHKTFNFITLDITHFVEKAHRNFTFYL